MTITLQPDQYERLNTFIKCAPDKLSEQARKCADYNGIIESEYINYAVIKIESYYNITRIVDEFIPIEVSDEVYPFDNERIYPSQRFQLEFSYKKWW